ncbi:hypothetical protein ACFWA4_15875 [Streptomyces sp. NPDC060011]|uniref:hypothetical protein n=1 Tax=Streptomyces sp. NPDC060011 TaxID=3347037 RepID=UPI0036ACC7FD
MTIEWDRIGQPEFDRRVEALLYRMFDGSNGRVTARNGRGGDEGIDVEVSTDRGLRIFQLKYYPDGFPGSLKGRRASIKKSFRTAMQHQPVEWTLVVPATLAPSERRFLDKLAEGHQVVISVMDRPALDNGFADFPHLETTFTRDHLCEAARDFNQEQALLFDCNDLVERVRRLGERADTVDEDWTWDFERRGDEVTRTLRALHPQAPERSPITIQMTGRPDGMNDQLTAAINRTWGFGIAEEVAVPPEALESLTIRGPEFIAGHITDATLTWRPITPAVPAGASAEISFRTANDVVTARHTGRLTSVGAGVLGTSIEIDVHGAVLQMMLPFNADTPATIRYSYDLDGRAPGEAARVLRIQQRLLQGGGLRVTIDGTPAGSGTFPATGTPEDLRHIQQMLHYFADLDVVQRHCEAFFPAPLAYTGRERIDLRVARLLIEGKCVSYPFARSLTFTLNGRVFEQVRALFEDRTQALRIVPPGFEISLGEHEMDLGPVSLFHLQLRIEGREAALAALDAGQGAGQQITLRPENGECFRIYLEGVPDDHTPLAVTPLLLDGLREPR